MPRRSEKSYIEQALSHALMTEMLYYALNETDTNDGDWEDLALILARVRSMRYLQRRSLGSAGRVLYTQHFDMIDQYLEFPDEGFRARFRMTREEFDDVIALLQANSTEEEWHTNNNSGRGCPGRSMAKQVALALSVLGGQEETLEKVRATFGIAKGSVYNYLWRFITVVCRLVTRLIQFPTKEKQRIKQQECDANDLFIGCIGYIDGSDIVLNEKPQRDWDMYYGRIGNQSMDLISKRYVMTIISSHTHNYDIVSQRMIQLHSKRHLSIDIESLYSTKMLISSATKHTRLTSMS